MSMASFDLRVAGAECDITEEQVIQHLRKSRDDVEHAGASPSNLYEDPEFDPGMLTTLYVDAAKLPEYASGESVAWHRPTEYTDDPDYFKSTAGCGVLREGALQDAWLLGVFAALALHPDNLIENLFVSESLHHFKQYGVYTCRFYKNCQWLRVLTDTRVPYSVALAESELASAGSTAPRGNLLYGSSLNKNEVFVPLLEKAYAKLHGSYQVLAEGYGGSFSSKILEAFVDCTGGSALRIDLAEEKRRNVDTDPALHAQWRRLVRYKKNGCIATMQLRQLSFNAYDLTPTGLLKNRQYVVLHVKEVRASTRSEAKGTEDDDNASVLRFVKLKNVWGRGNWKGDWSNDDAKWDEHQQVENVLRNDRDCEFSRSGSDGSFWMVWEDVIEAFNEYYIAHVFSNDAKYQYCAEGAWLGPSAAGSPAIKAKPHPASQVDVSSTGEAGESGNSSKQEEHTIARTRWNVLTDMEANWHRNPQFLLTVKEPTRVAVLSLLQRDFRLYGGDNYAINFVVLGEHAGRTSGVWEWNSRRVVAEAHSLETIDIATPASPPSAIKPTPERELLLEDVLLEPDISYVLIPYTDHAKVEMEFFLRVVANKPVVVTPLPALHCCVQQSKWRNDQEESGEAFTAGGPLCLDLQKGEENAAWCQNPQFWLRLQPMNPKQQAQWLATKAHATMKIIVRKTSHKSSTAARSRQKEAMSKDKGHLVGITVLRAIPPLENGSGDVGSALGLDAAMGQAPRSPHGARSKAVKTNYLGEVVEPMQAKVGGPRRHKSDDDNASDSTGEDASSAPPSFPLPRLLVRPDEWCCISEYSSPAVACAYLRKMPKEWLLQEHGGLMIVPTLGEANAEGSFDLQVDSDFPLVLDELPKTTTMRVPGEWNETSACGCHLHPEWKKNPKLYLQLKGVRPANVRITLARSELEWKPKCKRDAVGTMMGFYLFRGQHFTRASEESGIAGRSNAESATLPPIMVNGRPWSETDFVPLHAVTSPNGLILPIAFNEPYVIMPATYEPGKIGKFIVSVQCDTDFTLSGEEL